jgi:hypothetical protein
MVVAFIGSIVSFVVALLVGGLAIHVSTQFVVEADDFGRAVSTALFGAVAWALTSWIPLIGSIVALVAWVGVINWQYPGDWTEATVIGVGAWLSALLILLLVNLFLPIRIGAFGIPGA